MYRETEYRERCKARGMDERGIEAAVCAVQALEKEASGDDGTLASASLAVVERHVAGLVSRGEADETRIMALARYFAVVNASPLAIRLLAYLSPIGILQAMARRLEALEGKEVRDRVISRVDIPPSGSPPEAYPAATGAFVAALELELGHGKARRILTWNVHGIPSQAFADEKALFLASPSLDAWLTAYHARQVAVLKKHAEDGTLWYEQRITDAVVSFVAGNQEILSGVRHGDYIYMTKIPYDPDRFLVSNDPLERRRLACHCPLAASSITEKSALVPPLWCSCSAGYEKFWLDTVFGEETEAEVLESVLSGAERCRFRVRIPRAILKSGHV